MRGKRLFWISIIIVELVVFYVVWRPVRHRLARPSSHRAAVAPPVVRRPENKPSAVVIGPRKPLKVAHAHVPTRKMGLLVNAGLKSPEPVPAKPVPVPQASVGPLESFWCHLSLTEPQCDCKGKDRNDQQATNLVMQ